MMNKETAEKMETKKLIELEGELYDKINVMEENNETDSDTYKESKHDFNIISEILYERDEESMTDEEKEELDAEFKSIMRQKGILK